MHIHADRLMCQLLTSCRFISQSIPLSVLCRLMSLQACVDLSQSSEGQPAHLVSTTSHTVSGSSRVVRCSIRCFDTHLCDSPRLLPLLGSSIVITLLHHSPCFWSCMRGCVLAWIVAAVGSIADPAQVRAFSVARDLGSCGFPC